VNDDRGHGAMPKLYGAPAYARPQVPVVDVVARPFDPDALPLESQRSTLDQELVDELSPYAYASAADSGPGASPGPDDREGSPMLRGRPFFLRLPGRTQSDDKG
jgi:hypothetical protein